MTKINCTACGHPLTGGLDTFGEVAQPMCWACWSELEFPPDSTADKLNYWAIMGVKKQWEELDRQHGFMV